MKISMLIRTGGDNDLRTKIREFFRSNPYPSDTQVHQLAEKLEISPHDLETEIYSLLSDLLKE
jgi:hypothetical protein